MKKITTLLLFVFITSVLSAQTAIPEYKNKVMIVTNANTLESLELANLLPTSRGKTVQFAIAGTSSSVVYDSKKESSFIVKIDPANDPESSITLYKFVVNKKNRSIDLATAHGYGKATYDDQNQVKLNFKKVQDGVYIITASLEDGEYYFTVSPTGVKTNVPLANGFAFSIPAQ